MQLQVTLPEKTQHAAKLPPQLRKWLKNLRFRQVTLYIITEAFPAVYLNEIAVSLMSLELEKKNRESRGRILQGGPQLPRSRRC